MSISASAVTVELNISVWTANVLDKTATNTVIEANNALNNDAAQVRKNLMSGTTLRKKIADYAAGIRLWHNTHTLPWADKGARLLPTSLFMEYKEEMNERRDTFNAMVAEFVAEYPELIKIAQSSMGTLYDENDYPSPEQVADKFGFRMVFSPVPESGDFRLDIPKQDMEEMMFDYDKAFDDRLAEAMRVPWDKLHDMLTNMSAKLVESDDESKKRWYDSFITNAQDMCAMLTHLNLTKDPQLEAARVQLERALLHTDIDVIKESEVARSDLKSKLDGILKGFEW